MNQEVRQRIVWLASYPRSGNTWLRLFLANLVSLVHGDGKAIGPNEIHRFGAADNNPLHYAEVMDKPPEQATIPEVAAARPKVLRMLLGMSTATLVLKTHSARGTLAGVPMIDPDITAGAIYLVRNPLDVAVSFAAYLKRDVDAMIEGMASEDFGIPTSEGLMATYAGSWSEHVRSWTSDTPPGFLTLRYEDMVTDPEAAFGKVAKHLRIKADGEALVKAIDRASLHRSQTAHAELGFREAPVTGAVHFRKGAVGQWREALTEAQVERIVTRHKTQMARFGYLP